MNTKFALTFVAAFSAFTLFHPNTSFAGGTVVGDGGHSIQCKSDAGASFQLFDIYLAETHFHFGTFELPVLLQTDLSTELILRGFSQQLGLSPASDRLRTAISRAHMMAAFITEVDDVGYTQDSSYFEAVPANCEIKQLGVTRITPEMTNVTVVARDWQRLDSPQRALFLLHEALHFELRDPEAVRQVVAYMAASPFFQANNRAALETIFATGHAVAWSDFVL